MRDWIFPLFPYTFLDSLQMECTEIYLHMLEQVDSIHHILHI